MIIESNIKKLAKKKLNKYLELYKYRHTPERYALLDILYDKPKRFYIEDLHLAMQEKHIGISQATLYNSIRLFLKCNLIVKHQLGTNPPFFERTYNNKVHCYVICNTCHEIKEIKDDSLKFFVKKIQKKKFYPEYYCFYTYGLCKNCFRKKQIQQIKK